MEGMRRWAWAAGRGLGGLLPGGVVAAILGVVIGLSVDRIINTYDEHHAHLIGTEWNGVLYAFWSVPGGALGGAVGAASRRGRAGAVVGLTIGAFIVLGDTVYRVFNPAPHDHYSEPWLYTVLYAAVLSLAGGAAGAAAGIWAAASPDI